MGHKTAWEIVQKFPWLKDQILRWNLERIAKKTKVRFKALPPGTLGEHGGIVKTIKLDPRKLDDDRKLQETLLHELFHAAGLEELAARYGTAISTREAINPYTLALIGFVYNEENKARLAQVYRGVERFGKVSTALFATSLAASVIANYLGYHSTSSYFNLLASVFLGNTFSSHLFYLLNPRKKKEEELFRKIFDFGEVRFLRWMRKKGLKLGLEPTKEVYEKFIGERRDAVRDLFLLRVGLGISVSDPLRAIPYAPPGWLEREEGRRWIEKLVSSPELAERILSEGPKIPRWFFKEGEEIRRANRLREFLRKRLTPPARTRP